MRDFTIVLCSRKRESYLRNCLDHITKNSKTDVQVLIGCDIDDTRYLEIANELEQKYPCRLVFRTRDNGVQDFLNFLAMSSDSKYVFGINDDVNIVTKNWDTNARRVLDNFGDIVYGMTYDNSIDKIGDFYTGAPIISKKAINRLGFFMEPMYKNHGSDVITWKIYDVAKKIVDLRLIVQWDHVLHNSIESLKIKEKDQTNKEMIQRTFSSGFNINDLLNYDVSKYVEKLNA